MQNTLNLQFFLYFLLAVVAINTNKMLHFQHLLYLDSLALLLSNFISSFELFLFFLLFRTIFHTQYMISTLPLLFFILQQVLSSTFDYIQNGNFESPLVSPANGQYIGCPTNWTCSNMQILGSQYNTNILYGQFIDMEYYGFSNLSQVIQLPFSGTCNLDYRQGFFPGWHGYNCTLQIWWNGVLMATKPKATVMGNLQRTIVRGVQGSNVLLLKEVGTADFAGSVIDNFSLICIFDNELTNSNHLEVQYLLPTAVMKSVSVILSIPISSLSLFNYFFVIISDLWLYSFDQRNYTGKIKSIFNTINEIENKKLQALSMWVNISDYEQKLQQKFSASRYLNFTQPKFTQNEETSSTLLLSNNQFFIFTIPQNILVSLIFYWLFMLIKQYKISRFIRPYYFITTIIIQNLLQQHISYFTYICFSHLRISFTFQFLDKLSLIFTTFFMFVIVTVSFNFYYLIGQYLGKNSSYFHERITRGLTGYSIVTWSNLLRSLLRGSIYFFLRFHFNYQMIFLCMIELFSIVLSMLLNQNYSIFKRKTRYCLQLIYYLLHFTLNLTFYLQDAYEKGSEQKRYEIMVCLYEVEQIIICLLLVLTLLNFTFDVLIQFQ